MTATSTTLRLSSLNQHLCGTCRRLTRQASKPGYVDLLENQGFFHGFVGDDQQCSLCHLLCEMVGRQPKNGELTLHAFAHEGNPAAAYFKKRPPITDVLSQAAISWAREKVENETSTMERPLPTRVIAVGASGDTMIKLYEPQPGESGKYATLSYCWGDSPQFSATKDNIESLRQSVTLESLSRTVRDAIDVTRSIGLPYLWVDALCIVQNDADEMSREIEKMGHIYKAAAVTIAALSASAASHGFLELQRPSPQSCVIIPLKLEPPDQHGEISLVVKGRDVNLDKEPLCHRAWSFQELFLSPRTLLYTTGQLLWHSVKDGLEPHIVETVKSYRGDFESTVFPRVPLPHGGRNSGLGKSGTFGLDFDGGASSVYYGQCKAWAAMLTEYTSRKLTKTQDRLPALAGVANHLQGAWGADYTYGLWQNAIPDLLQWVVRSATSASQRSDRAPSWSWASLDCPIWYPGYLMPSEHAESQIEVIGVNHDGAITLTGWLVHTSEFADLADDETSWYHDDREQNWLDDFTLEVLLLLRYSTTEVDSDDDDEGPGYGVEHEVVLLLQNVDANTYTRKGVGRVRSRMSYRGQSQDLKEVILT